MAIVDYTKSTFVGFKRKNKIKCHIPKVVLFDDVFGVPGRLGRATTQRDCIPTRVHNSTKSFSKSPVGLYFSESE